MFIGRKKRKDECMRWLVGFPNGLDGDRSKAQKDLNGPDDVIRAQGERIVHEDKCLKNAHYT